MFTIIAITMIGEGCTNKKNRKRKMDEQKDKQTDRPTDRQTDGLTDHQIHIP